MRKPLRSHKPVEAAHSFAWRSGPASLVPVVRPLVDGEGAVDLVRDRRRTGRTAGAGATGYATSCGLS